MKKTLLALFLLIACDADHTQAEENFRKQKTAYLKDYLENIMVCAWSDKHKACFCGFDPRNTWATLTIVPDEICDAK